MNSPVLAAGASVTGVIVFVKAIITLAKAMQWFQLSEEQWSAWSVFFETIIPIAAVWGGAWWVARTTTPLDKPVDEDGAPLTRPDNTPAIGEIRAAQKDAIQMDKEITRGLAP